MLFLVARSGQLHAFATGRQPLWLRSWFRHEHPPGRWQRAPLVLHHQRHGVCQPLQQGRRQHLTERLLERLGVAVAAHVGRIDNPSYGPTLHQRQKRSKGSVRMANDWCAIEFRRRLVCWVLILLCGSTVGCGSSKVAPSNDPEVKQRLEKVLRLYRAYVDK